MVRPLLLSTTAAVLLATAATAMVPPKTTHWEFVDVKAPRTLEYELGCDKQLRGIYEDLAIYAVPETCRPKNSMVKAEGALSNLIVLERQSLEGDTYADIREWYDTIQDVAANFAVYGPANDDTYGNSGNGENGAAQIPFRHKKSRKERPLCVLMTMDIAGVPKNRVVATSNCKAEDMPTLIEVMPFNTEILPVRSEGFVAPLDRLPEDHPITVKQRTLKYKKSLQDIVDQVDIKAMEKDVTWLTGEATGSPFTTRSSTSSQSHKVAAWLTEQFESYGCDTVELMPYNSRFGPNVICKFKGTENPDEHVIIGAHHDDRGSFLNPRAPGADDDGSGSTMLLQTARIIKNNNLSFGRTLVIAAFSGEEQGLFGSAALAKKMKADGTTITMMIQGDMLAYRKPGEPIQVAFPSRYHTAQVTSLLRNVTELYVPEATVGTTGACCSDHQSFWESGFPATAFFERNGPIADPKYHNSGDLVYREGYDFEQLRASAKAMIASAFEVADVKA